MRLCSTTRHCVKESWSQAGYTVGDIISHSSPGELWGLSLWNHP